MGSMLPYIAYMDPMGTRKIIYQLVIKKKRFICLSYVILPQSRTWENINLKVTYTRD